jgi:hypothetical protein
MQDCILDDPVVLSSRLIMRPLRHLLVFLRELWSFARHRKAYWMIPLVVILLLVGGLLVSVSAVSPFVYSLF